jgi:midasin
VLEGHSLSLTERGDSESVVRHPDFRIFACMNPPTDFGKRDLPPSVRGRFHELYTHTHMHTHTNTHEHKHKYEHKHKHEYKYKHKHNTHQKAGTHTQTHTSYRYVDDVTDAQDIEVVVASFLDKTHTAKVPVGSVVNLHLEARALATSSLVDGAGHRPIFSLRTLCRALAYCRATSRSYGFLRSLVEGFYMAFCTPLVAESRGKMEALIRKHLLNNKTLGKQAPTRPGEDWLLIASFWLQKGPLPILENEAYIITPTVESRLKQIARAIVTRKYPVLLQGPTSVTQL